MSRVNKMSMEDILKDIQLMLRENDIALFCEDVDVIQEFIKRFKNVENKREEIKKFLIENEESIDKERFILLTVLNYKENLILIDAKKEELIRENPEKNFSQVANLHIQKKEQTNNLERAIKLGKGMEAFLTLYYYDDEEKRYKVDVIDSRELIDGKKISNTKNLNRFNEIDLSFKGEDKDSTLGMEYIIQSILLTDLYQIFPTEEFGNSIRTMMLENEVLIKGLKSKEELEKLKTIEHCDEYADFIDSISFQEMLPNVKETLKEYVKYVDIDKLLLISAYRFYEGLENGYIDQKLVLAVKEILNGILIHFKSKGVSISCQLQSKKDGAYENVDVKYSVKDIIKCINKFTDKEYLTDEQIKEYKEQIINREMNLSQIDSSYLNILYTQEELEEIAMLSDENFKTVLTKLEWSKDKIINALNKKGKSGNELLNALIENQTIDSKDIITLYMNENISLEQMENIKENINLAEIINSYELIQYYKNSIELNSNEEDRNKFDKYSDLYRESLIKEESQETLEEKYNQLVDSLLDNYQGEDYIKVASEFYKKGLIPLEVLVEWNGEKIVDIFYKNELISLEDIEKLANLNKISFEYISGIYKKMANKNSIDYDERLKYISTGYVLEEEIFALYEKGLIFETDLRNLAQKGIVRVSETEKLINNRTKEDLEKNSSIKLKGLNELKKITNEIYSEDDEELFKKEKGEEKEEIPKYIIDPNKREEFINMFNAYRAETDLEEDSPFYDYEFYVIPDESGEIGLNSAIIAERYYDDKNSEEKFALNNATYFFRYKDLMVLSNLKKSEMTKERENVVYTAKHILADENKNGYWAAGVIYGIAKTMLSSDLKEHTKTEQRKIIIEKLNQIYSEEQILEILDMASKIDSGEYTYKIVNPEEKILRKSVKTRKQNNNIIDEDKQR